MLQLCVLLLIQVVGHVWTERLPPPRDVRVVEPLVSWRPARGHNNATYTVQYHRFNDERWNDVASCSKTTSTSCNVGAVMIQDDKCVHLRVRADDQGQTSDHVEACSPQGDSCSPSFKLSALPGQLTVHAQYYDHIQYYNLGGHLTQRITYGREGAPLQATDSEEIPGLEEGARYCVQVQFLYHELPLGPPGCVQCTDIPVAEMTQQTKVTIGVVLGVTVVLVLLGTVYIILFQRERIKKWMRPPYQMAECIITPVPELPQTTAFQPSEEHTDQVSFLPV